MTTRETPIQRWARRIHDPALKPLANRNNIVVHDDTVYSYGRHFEMARVLRDAKGRATLILINGDVYGTVSSAGHQSEVRGIIGRDRGDVPSVILPHSALRAAGIDLDSIMPLDTKPDGWVYSPTSADKLPDVALKVSGRQVYRGEDWIGRDYANESEVLAMPSERGTFQIVERDAHGRYTWQQGRHWLGEAVVSARVHGRARRVKFMSGFDRNERERLYFLCELPATRAVTVEDALESLKPDTVRMAEGMGRTCERQGDIFAVPMPGMTWRDLKRDGGTVAKRSDARRGMLARDRAERLIERLVQAEDVRFRTPDYLAVLAARREAVYGRMPWGTPRPLADWGRTRDMTVRREAEDRARVVANHREAKWADLLRARVADAQARTIDPAGISLLGTAHTATHVVTMPDGTQYAKGTMYHDPALMGEDRDRDHARCKMGDGATWFLIQKNTVPVAKAPRTGIETATAGRW